MPKMATSVPKTAIRHKNRQNQVKMATEMPKMATEMPKTTIRHKNRQNQVKMATKIAQMVPRGCYAPL